MKKLFIIIFLLCSCSTVTRLGLAGTGASLGSLAGPPGAAAGAMIGSASADIILQNKENKDLKQEIKNLTINDVQGYTEPLVDKIYTLIKIIAGVVLIGFIISWLYTYKRKQFAQKFYKIVEDINEKRLS